MFTENQIQANVRITYEDQFLGEAALEENVNSFPPYYYYAYQTFPSQYVTEESNGQPPVTTVTGVASGPSEIGIIFEARVQRPALFESLGPGRFSGVQLAKIHRTRYYFAGTTQTVFSGNTWKLDNSFPYEPDDGVDDRYQDGWEEQDPNGEQSTETWIDDPTTLFTGVLTPYKYTSDDDFKMFLSYLPPRNPEVWESEWCGIHVIDWKWKLTAEAIDGIWQPIVEEPKYSGQLQSCDFQMVWLEIFTNI